MQQLDIFGQHVFRSNLDLNVLSATRYAVDLESQHASVLVSGTVDAWQSKCMQVQDIEDQATRINVDTIVSVITDVLTCFGTPKLKHLWFNINRGSAANKVHCHTTPWVAVWYLKTEDTTASLMFYPDTEKTKSFEFRPQVGDLLIFPGSLYHEVPANTDSGAVRISCALNFFV
jgi:hypothetical protein